LLLQPGDVLLTLGAGDSNQVADGVVTFLQANEQTKAQASTQS
jgi:hypothetical protein